jgi:hypothetical protein
MKSVNTDCDSNHEKTVELKLWATESQKDTQPQNTKKQK